MSATIDKEAVYNAYEDVRNDQTDTNWYCIIVIIN